MMHVLRLGVVPAYLFLCLVFGGASAAGFWANMVLQFLAILIIFWSVARTRNTPMSAPAKQGLGILLLMLLLILAQLIPLPPGIWTSLPGRGSVAQGFALLGRPLPWLPLSLEPQRTIDSLLWLLPAIAVYQGIARLGYFKARWIAWSLAGTTVVSVAIGALQVAAGEGSPWYFYKITNFGVMTGFFSNANHLATLLVVTIPFLGALYLEALRKERRLQESAGLLLVLGATLVVIFTAIAINASIAGLGLSVPVLAATVMMMLSGRFRVAAWAAPVVGLLMIASLAIVLTAPFGNNLTGASARTSEDSRYRSFSVTADAAADFAPVGSGIGTFQQVYREREDPTKVTQFFMNHAHSDYLELALETGAPGIVLLLLFLLWWGIRTVAIWTAEAADNFAKAATIASGAILAHSAVDYPLRTAAIGAVFAMCCALMAEPRAKVRRAPRTDGSEARHLSAD